MKKIRIFILVLFIILLTGCKGEYNLIINKDLSIDEDVNIYIENKDNIYDKTISLFENNNIDDSMYSVSQTDEFVNIRYKETFRNFEDYFVNSKFYSRIISNEDYNKSNKKISYKGLSNIKFDDLDTNSNLNNTFDISELKINVKIPFIIRDNNADKSSDDTLTWVIKQNDSHKNINFSFDYLKRNNLYMLIIILCAFIIIVPVSIIVRNYLKER